MTHLSLFSGIGGLDLAAEMAGFTTVGQAERDDYCNGVLDYHWPNVPRWRDVKDVTAETFEQKTGIKPGTLAVLSGGFPCQPVSCAGKRKGDTDERWLWDEMLRVICEIRPRWVVAENVRGLLSAQAISDGRKLFGRILRDLAQNGYRVGWLCYGAGDVGAPHKRERVFIVAHSRGGGFSEQGICREQQGGAKVISTSESSCRMVANPPQHLLNRPRQTGQAGRGEFADGGDVADAESRQDNRREPGELAGKAEAGASYNSTVNPGGQDVAYADVMHREQCWPLGRMGREGEPDQGDGRGQGPTQPRLGMLSARISDGLAGHRWPAGWWPTPRATDGSHGGPNQRDSSGRHGLAGAIHHWPAGPGPQHPWEPPRIATGVRDRVAKLKALGNAVVPAQAYPIFRAIMEIEEAIP